MQNDWLNSVEDQLSSYLYSLQSADDKYHFLPVKKGLTLAGESLTLGFSCYSLKLNYILNLFSIKDLSFEGWSRYINSYQKNLKSLPDNSFIDQAYLEHYKKFRLTSSLKYAVKNTLNLTRHFHYESRKEYLEKSIRAETKQAISSLSQIGLKNKLIYKDFPQSSNELNYFFNSYDWSKPWDAGAQFSGICVFTATQLEKSNRSRIYIENFISKLADKEHGIYFKDQLPNTNEAINGAMKVISGLDWLEIPIHYPKKLIDFCLSNTPSPTGCDLVDYVYVLYKCSSQTNYRKKEIVIYCQELLDLIEKHFHIEGGFSYFIDKSQTHYYGIKISKGYDQPDIHGTLLLVWAMSMIFKLMESNKFDWKVIKP